MAKRNIPVDLFYASYNSDCTYELNSRALESFAIGETEKNNWNALCVRYLNSIGVDDIY